MSLDVVTSPRVYEERVGVYALPFIYLKGGIFYRVESTPVALTACSMDGRGDGWFSLRIPRVPQYILKAIYLFFEQVAEAYETEVRVRILYNSLTGKFELDLPEQKVTNASVYTLDSEYACVGGDIWPVLDMHSHCRFPAMFSAVDNHNELGNWVFGVIGSFGRRPQLMLRAGTGGNFMPIAPEDIFAFSSVDDEKAKELAQMLFDQTEEKLWLVS